MIDGRKPMLDHVGIIATEIGLSRAFYEQALAPLGISIQMAPTPDMIAAGYEGYGFGEAGKPYFWVAASGPGRPSGPIHIAFAAGSRALVDQFHAAALAAGGTDNGAPGLRPHYHPNYYGAFVLDPDGNNIEAVCHHPE
jgi:catechol 2,3-dioxygenase-like lactoylglutathione lyase family enzyme